MSEKRSAPDGGAHAEGPAAKKPASALQPDAIKALLEQKKREIEMRKNIITAAQVCAVCMCAVCMCACVRVCALASANPPLQQATRAPPPAAKAPAPAPAPAAAAAAPAAAGMDLAALQARVKAQLANLQAGGALATAPLLATPSLAQASAAAKQEEK